jgi:hypothetical protein
MTESSQMRQSAAITRRALAGNGGGSRRTATAFGIGWPWTQLIMLMTTLIIWVAASMRPGPAVSVLELEP